MQTRRIGHLRQDTLINWIEFSKSTIAWDTLGNRSRGGRDRYATCSAQMGDQITIASIVPLISGLELREECSQISGILSPLSSCPFQT